MHGRVFPECLLFDLKKDHFGTVFKLNLMKKIVLTLNSVKKQQHHNCKRRQLIDYTNVQYIDRLI